MTGPPSTGGQNVRATPRRRGCAIVGRPSPVVTTIPTPAPSPASPDVAGTGVGYSEPPPTPTRDISAGVRSTAAAGRQYRTAPRDDDLASGGPPPAPPAAVVEQDGRGPRKRQEELLAVVNAELDHGRTADAHRHAQLTLRQPGSAVGHDAGNATDGSTRWPAW